MNKSELIDAIADDSEVSKKDVGSVLDSMFETVMKQVSRGNKVTIPGIVSFEQVDRKARKGFNPQTKEPIDIPASKAVKVTAGSKLKAAAKG